ncbi:MAG: hypothetical protein KatS3mg101_0820 [Patescibacteria group bacterium]|nr:MAG: hypothetical protein KatS3mg101_0820 [Patescibacteria group bacterium]
MKQILKLIEVRGFTLDMETAREIAKKHEIEEERLFFARKDKTGLVVFIARDDEKKIYAIALDQLDDVRYICVTEDQVRQSVIRHPKLDTIDITFFTKEELLFNPLEHVYNGLNASIVKLDNIDVTKFPRISRNDPTAKYLGAKPGEVIRFEVTSPIPGTLLDKEITFRYVVDS